MQIINNVHGRNPCEQIKAFVQSRTKLDVAIACLSLSICPFSGLVGATVAATYVFHRRINNYYENCEHQSNDVNNIYTPTSQTISILDPRKIQQLREDPRVMGITFTFNGENVLVPIYIKVFRKDIPAFEGFGTSCPARTEDSFYAFDFSDRQIGFAFTKSMLKSNDYLKGFWLGAKEERYVGNGVEKKEVNKILLDQVTNQSQYKNIGVILNKAIHQKYQDECQGRMVIDAVRGTHPYHYKLGFRAFDPQKRILNEKLNSLFASYVQRKEIPNRDLGLVTMYLPDRARELWLQEVKRNPIGFPRELREN